MKYLLGKIHVPHQIDKTLGKSLYRGDNPHLVTQFLRMSQASNFIKVSEPVKFKDHLLIHAPSRPYQFTHQTRQIQGPPTDSHAKPAPTDSRTKAQRVLLNEYRKIQNVQISLLIHDCVILELFAHLLLEFSLSKLLLITIIIKQLQILLDQ